MKKEDHPKPTETSNGFRLEERSVDALRLYLISILQNHTHGDSINYKNLLYELRNLFQQSISSQAQSPKQKLQAILTVLSSCVSEIHPQHHSTLYETIINVPLADYTTDIQELLLSVYVNTMLMYCDTSWGVLCSLAISMVPFKVFCMNQNPLHQWEPPPHLASLQDRILDHVAKIAVVKPHIGPQLLEALVFKEPHAFRRCESHCLYITVLLNMTKRPFAASMIEHIWEKIIQHLVLIDSNVMIDDLVREKEIGNEMDEASSLFEIDLEDNECHINGKISHSSQQKAQVHMILSSMDAMMELILIEMERFLEDNAFEKIWKIIMHSFTSLLVSTHQAQFSHFLIFYLTQKKPQYLMQNFAPLCLEKVKDEWTSPGIRSSFASYIASLLARARFSSNEIKFKCVETLLKISEKHARDYGEESKSYRRKAKFQSYDQQDLYLDMTTTHELFYACIQAMMYLLCYMLPTLFHEETGNKEMYERMKGMLQKRVSSLLYHWLRPLRHTATAVVVHFVNLVYELQIMDCRNLIDKMELDCTIDRIQAFFPFDPYCLNRSSCFLNLKNEYVTWKEVISYLPKSHELANEQSLQDSSPFSKFSGHKAVESDDDMSVASFEDRGNSMCTTTPQSHGVFGTSVESMDL